MATKSAPKNAITGYCMKTKKKDVPMHDVVIDFSSGKYFAKGHDGTGNKMSVVVGREKAEKAVADGVAEAGTGWPKASKKK